MTEKEKIQKEIKALKNAYKNGNACMSVNEYTSYLYQMLQKLKTL